jgi:hypothetical protein
MPSCPPSSQTNVLVDDGGHARLGGLGAALTPPILPRMDIDRFFHGAAPELFGYRSLEPTDTGATKASDVYAFGALAYEVSARFKEWAFDKQLRGDLTTRYSPATPHSPTC